jgi:hypothetical protein
MKPDSMRNLRLLPFLCVAALAACGGGKKAAPEPSTGVLEGKVLGVHYQTATQFGVTDGNGTFTYMPGETVTFSIGAVQLGAVPGAARISLFTLAGETAPTTELALRRDLDRAIHLRTPLTRAMNLARLLIALDSDGNPDNGFDIAGRTADLANKPIDLGLGLFEFATRLDRLAPDLTRNIPTSRTLTQLYQSAQITVPAHAPTRYDNTFGPGLTLSTTVTYHANGAISEESTEPGTLVPGIPVLVSGVSHAGYTYDALGRSLSVVSESLGNLFQLPSTFRSSSTYDLRGNRIGTVVEREQDPDTLMNRTTFSGTADAYGHFPESTTTVDSNGDGVVDARNTATETFDERGNSTAGTFRTDTNADGVVDSSYQFTRTFEANNLPRTEAYEYDTNGDGVVDERSVTTFAEEAPRSFVTTVLTDYDADGEIDNRDVTRWTFDEAGDNVLATVHYDHGTDGTLYGSAEFRMTYDTEHRLLSRVRTNDYEGDGITDQTDVSTYVYDGVGNLLSVTQDSDGGFSFWPAHQRVAYEYGPDGERTAFSSTLDLNGDGVFESSSTTNFTQQVFTDGVGLIAHQYFEGAAVYVDGQSIIGGVSTFAATTGIRRSLE